MPLFAGAGLLALPKLCGGVRLIAVDKLFRRLTAKHPIYLWNAFNLLLKNFKQIKKPKINLKKKQNPIQILIRKKQKKMQKKTNSNLNLN